MVLLTNPNSRQGAIFLINLASEVPPVVEKTGLIFVIFLIILFDIITVFSGLVKKESPLAINSILLPRILTQVCRDKFSPLYGSFDRNWWHYKIRDFSSIILQQGGYSLYCYFKDSNEYKSNNSKSQSIRK